MSLFIVTDNHFYGCGMHDIADALYLVKQDRSDSNNNILNSIASMSVNSDDVFIVNLNCHYLIMDVLRVIKKLGNIRVIVESDFYLHNEMLMVSNVIFLARKYSREQMKDIISDVWKKPVWRCRERRVIRNNVTIRECSVLSMLATGKSKAQISKLLEITEKTITQHKMSAIKKIGLNKLNDVEAFRLLRLLLAVKDNPNKKLEFQILNSRNLTSATQSVQ